MSKTHRYIVKDDTDISTFYSTESLTYLDTEGVERVAYSSGSFNAYHELDLCLDDYLNKKSSEGVKLKVIDEKEVEERIKIYSENQKEQAKEIDKQRWWYMLEILPPCRWDRIGNVELFHVSERICFDLVSWFAEINGRYFELVDDANATYEHLINRFEQLYKTNKA